MQGGEPLFPNYFPATSGRSISGGRLKHASEAITLVQSNDPNLVGTLAAAWGDAGLHNETFWLGWATVAQYGWTTNRPTVEQSTVDFMVKHFIFHTLLILTSNSFSAAASSPMPVCPLFSSVGEVAWAALEIPAIAS